MIPPCDLAILQSNPRFKKLHRELTTSLLNPDASTRATDAQPARRTVVEDLKRCRTQNAKKQILKRTLRQLAFSESDLPDDHRDNVAVISLYLDSTGQYEGTLSLLGPDIDTFTSNLPTTIPPFSRCLSSAVTTLQTVADAGSPTQPAAEPRSRLRARHSMPATPTLSSQLRERCRTLREMQLIELPASRSEMTQAVARVLAAQAQVLEETVVLLERTKHGALARATKAKADHLATVARGLDGKLNVMKLDILGQIYTPETIAALNRYREHLGGVRERLEERQALAREGLKGYEDVEAGDGSVRDTGPMGEIARRYGELAREVETVKMEIRRLA